MTAIIKPGAGVLFMKVGTHANEDLDSIIARKTKEIEDAGYGMWGYGGNTCHPRSMVQPFAEIFEQRGQPIHLVMEKMTSRHFAEQLRADEYSADNLNWTEIPPDIRVLGSRFALVIKSLEKCEMLLPLNQTRVPVGRSMGRIGSRYLRGQADKACLEVLDHPEVVNDGDRKEVGISLVAELMPPYAVFLRNKT
ncbi:hypothetical protein BAE42_16190 [Mesorhizobium loti]|uniref:Uncharacterized protein n=1 Tax=Mesorhizobium erdmanii TaxID=1777866 RepID=A0A6M7UQC5_9HYPH|nr:MULTISPECIES: hypothetical protein [Mesorhizobium]OBP72349.1 hypothetical protein BAE42_16190 [Mesorhizobium loti]OBQ62574.1 hypothetical protein A8146_15690 [Mesorhizobium loti]QKC79052.1 hypothetical protein EB233_29060 [Mesorhizobium erdmanii]